MADQNGKGKAERAAWRGAFNTADEALAVTPAEGNERLRLYAVTDPAGDVVYTWASSGTWAIENVAVAAGFKAKLHQQGVPVQQLVDQLTDADLARMGLARVPPPPVLKVVPAPEVVPAEEALEVAENEAAYLAEETGRTKGKRRK